MLCTAVYMRKYGNVTSKIAALSPCIAKTHEFEATGIVSYNVTFKHLQDYIEKNHIRLSGEPGEFDHFDAGLGALYPMPGGLKECVEHYLGKSLRVDKSEGPQVVYKALNKYAEQPASNYPVLFDVLNCAEGCNLGTGCHHLSNEFEINTTMDRLRQSMISDTASREYLEELFTTFDEYLNLNDFIRTYKPAPVKKIAISVSKVEEAFKELGKITKEDREYDCGACGNESCLEMAQKIAKGIDIVNNCSRYVTVEMAKERRAVTEIQQNNNTTLSNLLKDIGNIKNLTDNISGSIKLINEAILMNSDMVKDIERIAMEINIISLNASIESTRAGEHGKAFAVVAEEIRNLAKNSTESAQKTKETSSIASTTIVTINDTIKEIGDNVNVFYTAVQKITESTKKVLVK
jgi:hypothetical protein